MRNSPMLPTIKHGVVVFLPTVAPVAGSGGGNAIRAVGFVGVVGAAFVFVCLSPVALPLYLLLALAFGRRC